MFKFATHNTKGINKQTDQNNILQEYKKLKIDILGLCKTKLISKSITFSFQNQNKYKILYIYDDTKLFSAGVILLIHRFLTKHIHQIKEINGQIFIAKLFFKEKRILYII